MTEQPAEPTPEDKGQSDQPKPKPKPQAPPTSWWGSLAEQYSNPPRPVYPQRQAEGYKFGPEVQGFPASKEPSEDEKLARALDELLKPLVATSERPPVELSQERRAHVAQRSAEFKEWLANGMSRTEALQLVAMEIQLHWRFNKGQGG